jgi:DNA-binding transcriptional LysR family regulator
LQCSNTRHPVSEVHMELRHLRYFTAVANERSFTRAAEKLRLAQPSLTRQVKNLEEELGIQLLNRIKGRVSLTRDGCSFLIDAKRILAMTEESVQSIRRARSEQPSQLSVGYATDLHCHLLPTTLATFRRSCPRVSLNLFDMTCSEQLAALEAGDIDLGFVSLQQFGPSGNVERLSVAQYDVLVAVPERSALSKQQAIDLGQLRTLLIIGLSEKALPGWRDWMARVFSAKQVEPQVVQEADAGLSALKCVAFGLGVALLPEQVKRLFPHHGVVFRSLKPSVRFDTYIAWKSDNTSGHLRKYIQIVKDAAAIDERGHKTSAQVALREFA